MEQNFNIIYKIKGTNKTYSVLYKAEDDMTARSKFTTDILAGKIDEIKDIAFLHIISSNPLK